MPCVECSGSVWICSDDENIDCRDLPPGVDATLRAYNVAAEKTADVEQEAQPPEWEFVSCRGYMGGLYFLKFKPGNDCDVRLETHEETEPGWKLLGSKSLGMGTFALFCKTGGGPGGPFKVAVKAVLNCQPELEPGMESDSAAATPTS